MARKPSEGIGKRLATYRRLRGLSARELAEQSGMGLTRGIIANIESGRKTDITVDQLIALSTTLGVPPVALALPIDEPYRRLTLTDGSRTVTSPTMVAVSSFIAAEASSWIETGLPPFVPKENPAAYVASETVKAVLLLPQLESRARALPAKIARGEVAPEVADEYRSDIEQLRATLARLGADLTADESSE